MVPKHLNRQVLLWGYFLRSCPLFACVIKLQAAIIDKSFHYCMIAVARKKRTMAAFARSIALSSVQSPENKMRFELNKLQKRLRRLTATAITDYNMIENGDRVMVCLSGGKDSYTMLDMLLALKKIAPIEFDVVAVNMDQKQPGFPEQVLPTYLDNLGIEYHIVEKDTYSVVKSIIPEGKTTCGLCSRLRRGTLYGFAERIGATKVALGHHKDDIVETLFLNLFYGGRLKAMPPKLRADDGRNIVIRPLAYCREVDIENYATQKKFPIIPCNLCGSQENLQRQNIKAMLQNWEREAPGRVETIFSALQNVSPSQLADKNIFDFIGLTIDRTLPSEVEPRQNEGVKIHTVNVAC
jgi:tRNA 2-thiocytidine biosynthesis protein TtcA